MACLTAKKFCSVEEKSLSLHEIKQNENYPYIITYVIRIFIV